jgi:hypothetical protein
MTRHPIRKFLGLFVLYTVIILGIFALQFRSQSIFSKNFAQLRLTLTQNKDETQNIPYSDTFYIAYKGMTLFSDEENKSVLTYANGNQVPLVFQTGKKLMKIPLNYCSLKMFRFFAKFLVKKKKF